MQIITCMDWHIDSDGVSRNELPQGNSAIRKMSDQ
jgi:hypothetical protein